MICVGEFTVKNGAATVPNVTAVTVFRLVPKMVTLVPPAAGPFPGLTRVTVGGVTKAY